MTKCHAFLFFSLRPLPHDRGAGASPRCRSDHLTACLTHVKRTTRKYCPCLGHRKGVHGEELLGYLTARKQIYLPKSPLSHASLIKAYIEGNYPE